MTIYAVGAVIYRVTGAGRLQVLIIRKRGGMWTLPKGKLKRDETPEAGLLREVAEETGLTGDIGELVTRADYQIKKAGRRRRKVVSYYLMRANDGQLSPGIAEGIEQVRWMQPERALQRIGRPGIRAIVRAALTHLAG
jgi:8-oxo-dGTP diphosphatase